MYAPHTDLASGISTSGASRLGTFASHLQAQIDADTCAYIPWLYVSRAPTCATGPAADSRVPNIPTRIIHLSTHPRTTHPRTTHPRIHPSSRLQHAMLLPHGESQNLSSRRMDVRSGWDVRLGCAFVVWRGESTERRSMGRCPTPLTLAHPWPMGRASKVRVEYVRYGTHPYRRTALW